MNGWGYAAGAVSGMVLSLIQAFVPYLGGFPLYVTFPAIIVAVLAITITVTLLTEPTDEQTLRRFYSQVRPSGFWKPVAREVRQPARRFGKAYSLRSLWSILVGIPWMIALYLLPTYLVLHRYDEALITLAIVAAGVILFVSTPGIMMGRSRQRLMSGMRVGMTRSEVIAVKGQPDHVARSLRDVRTGGWYPAPTKPVEKEVLEYHDFIWKLYVYIGRDDRVTYLHLART